MKERGPENMVMEYINRKADLELKRDLLSLQSINKATADSHLTKLKKDLLSHLHRYPRAKFSAGAIPHNVSPARHIRKVDIEKALEGLVRDKLIEKHISQQGQLFYCLNTDTERREPVFRPSTPYKNEVCPLALIPDSNLMLTKLRQLRLLEEPVFIGGSI